MATRTLPWISSELPADLFPSKSGFSPSSQTVGTVIDIFSLFVSLSVNVYVCVCVCVCVWFSSTVIRELFAEDTEALYNVSNAQQ